MRKTYRLIIALSLLLSILSLSLFGCDNKPTLFNNVSELKSNLFMGKTENFSISASYGFCETPYINDKKVGKLDYILTFSLLEKPTDKAAYTVTVDFSGKTFSASFKPNYLANNLKAVIYVEDFDLDNFPAKISFGSTSEVINMTSILPQNTLSPKAALQLVAKEQTALIESFTDSDGNFDAEIYMRVIVKEEKPYYYVGFASGNDKLKALLVDGITGKTLAIREIF